MSARTKRIFLISPANAAGRRAAMVLREQAQFELALRLRNGGVPIGELFSFISGLYFRGKLSYARAFAAPPARVAGIWVITGDGLIAPDTLVDLKEFQRIAAVPIDAGEPRYRESLVRDAAKIAAQIGLRCEVVLLGSIATPKYAEPLLGIFGGRLMFPVEFVGRGDMSRGGLLLRSARAGSELTYTRIEGAQLHGSRPPKLPRVHYGP